MRETEQLKGIALRRAVATAVGWTWRNDGITEAYGYAKDGDFYRLEGREPITWNDAMAAADAAGLVNDDHRLLYWNDVAVFQRWKGDEEWESLGIGGEGDGPEAVCRALLAALEARKNGFETVDPIDGRGLCPKCHTREGVHGGCNCGYLNAKWGKHERE